MVTTMLFTSGYWRRGSFRGLPLRWHWSVLFGLFIAGGFGVAPLSWLVYLGLIQCHLMAHSLAVRAGGMTPVGLDIQALGGKVRWRGHASVPAQLRASWAGVAGQLVPMLIAKVILMAHGGVTASWLGELERVAIHMNAVMLAINLMPLPTFDGEVAWKVVAWMRQKPVDSRRVVVMEVAASGPAGVLDQVAVADEVAREVSALARAANDRAGVS